MSSFAAFLRFRSREVFSTRRVWVASCCAATEHFYANTYAETVCACVGVRVVYWLYVIEIYWSVCVLWLKTDVWWFLANLMNKNTFFWVDVWLVVNSKTIALINESITLTCENVYWPIFDRGPQLNVGLLHSTCTHLLILFFISTISPIICYLLEKHNQIAISLLIGNLNKFSSGEHCRCVWENECLWHLKGAVLSRTNFASLACLNSKHYRSGGLSGCFFWAFLPLSNQAY